MKSPVIIELYEVEEQHVEIENLLKPKVAPAKRMSEKQLKMIEAYKLFQEKYVK